MSSLLVTIAVPAFKAQYLEQCLRSALAQTYASIDLVVVDDSSPEPIEAIVEGVGGGRIRYYRNSRNVGRDHPARNWNRCLSLAKGEWFCLLGDDDLYLPEFVEQAMAAATAAPKVDLVRTGVTIINEAGVPVRVVSAQAAREDWLMFLWERTCNDRQMFASENFIRTSSLRRLGGYVDFPAAWCSDDATLLALAHAGGVANVHRLLACWRSSTSNLSTTATVHSRLAAIEHYRRWLEQRLSQWTDEDPRLRQRLEWVAIQSRLSARWSDLRVDAMGRSWATLREAIWRIDRVNGGYPSPNMRETIRCVARLIKHLLYQWLRVIGVKRGWVYRRFRQAHEG